MPNDFRLVPGSLPEPYCFTSFQQLNIDLFSLAQVISVNGSQFYNLGEDEPDLELRDFPWFRTLDGWWYFWSVAAGAWVRPHPTPPSGQERRIWVGNLTDLQTYDGGSALAPGPADGPMWEEDTAMRARFPLGAGTLPSTTVIANGTTGGEENHVLTTAELPENSVPQQFVPFPEPPSGAYLNHDTVIDTDIGVNRDATQNIGDGESHNNMPPYYGVYFIKRTARVFLRPA